MKGEVLRERLLSRGGTMSALARQLDMSPQHLHQQFGSNDIKSGMLERVRDRLGVPIHELYGEPEHIYEPRRGCAPYYNVSFELGFSEMLDDPSNTPEYLLDCGPMGHCDAWCNATGSSMTPTILSGDVVGLRRVEDFRYLVNGDIYAIVTRNGLRTIKRVEDRGETLLLTPDNDDYQPQEIPKAELLHVFRVTGVLRQM